jgi:hypothetical protein
MGIKEASEPMTPAKLELDSYEFFQNDCLSISCGPVLMKQGLDLNQIKYVRKILHFVMASHA